VPKIAVVNDVINLFSNAISIFVISNRNSFRVLIDKIASVYFIWKIYLHFSTGCGQPKEPALPAEGSDPDPGARALALSMWPLHTLGAPPAVITWRRRCITLPSSYNSFCFCRRTVAFLQRGRTAACPTMGRLIPAIRCTLAINPEFSVAPCRLSSMCRPFDMADYNPALRHRLCRHVPSCPMSVCGARSPSVPPRLT